MSRGLGKLQRDILAVYDQAVPQPRGPQPTTYDPNGPQAYDSRECQYYAVLRRAVAERRRGWCATECRAPGYRHGWHYPHLDWRVLGDGFVQEFARAMRTLIRRGALVAVDREGRPLSLRRHMRLQWVARRKC